MTTMLESPVALRRGRDLVSPELFEKVSEFCAQEYGHELSTAHRRWPGGRSSRTGPR
ncbi:hypothetical protein AB0I68_23995 [Streptomyces sp. NPDC050448]|uniref:hypothetical protein n=1 Tax=Streptomyces sp. NPDC050448 TaxID=3155404 RepID=UPI0034192431